MELFIQQVINGVSLGGTYALLALGLAIVFTIMHLVNFAHGELITVPGYAMYGMSTVGIGWGFAAPAALAVGVLGALIMDRVAFRPVRNASPATLLLTSLGVSIIIQGSLQTFVSPRERGVPQPQWIRASVEVFGIRLQASHLVAIFVTATALAGLRWLLHRTRVGMSMRAAAQDFDAARLVGVPANRVVAVAFALSGALAGLASVLILARQGSVSPSMGLVPVLKAFVAVVLGGFGSLEGAVVGGLALGFGEVMLRAWLPGQSAGFVDGLLFALIGAVLVWRPDGIVRARVAVRV